MAKKITGYVKLQVPAGAANPSPPIGPALGQRGLNIMEFCKAFNAKTAQMEKGTPIPVIITAYQDRSFTFEMKQPPVTFFLKKAVGLKIGKKPASGSKTPGKGPTVGKITEAQLREIAEKKMPDLNCDSVDSAVAMIRVPPGPWASRSWREEGLMAREGKRIRAAREGIDVTKLYPLAEAIKLVKERASAKFDETFEVSMNLGVDPRHADQMVRGVCNLPNGSGRTVRVAVFARGAKADDARAPVPTSSARRISWKSSRAARSSSTAASRPRT